ncbi:MAG: hypothetical protein K5648_06190, partial [Erysipelotrichaceae bacterium]|nr:hypothetical protein [Erysipelotrichaceae bacterium]
MKKLKDNKVKAERTKYTGVQKCAINGEVYYRGRVKFAGKDYYTDKCSIARDAVKLREQLKADLQEQKATNQPIQTV